MTDNLYEVRLPSDGVRAFDVNWSGWVGSNRDSYTVPDSYDGIRFIGEGPERTVILPDWDGTTSYNATVNIGASARHVVFENLRINCPAGTYRKAIHASDSGMHGIAPYSLALRGVDVVEEDGPTHWGVFTYQCDLTLEDCNFYMPDSREHGVYAHGWNAAGARVERCSFVCGGEDFKNRNDSSEILFAPGWLVAIKECEFLKWHGPNSWRGGAGIVLQGAAADVNINRCTFHGQANNGRCIAISDAGSYDMDGVVDGPGPHVGHVRISKVQTSGLGNESYNNSTIRCAYSTSREGPVAKSFKMRRAAAYGFGTKVEVKGIEGEYLIADCNTPRLKSIAEDLGVDTQFESRVVDGKGPMWDLSRGTP